MEAFNSAPHSRVSVCQVHGEHQERGISLSFGNGKDRLIWHGCAACHAAKRASEAAEQAAKKRTGSTKKY